jgi:hypothetical protein
MNPNPHPVAKIFAPVVFLTLALLTVGFSFAPEQAEPPASVSASKGASSQ